MKSASSPTATPPTGCASFCSPKAAARHSSPIWFLTLLLIAGCSERDVMEFTLEQSLSIALKLQCEEDPDCLAALDAQLEGCIQQNEELDALIAAGGSDDALSRRVGEDIAGCIVDEHGESYFSRETYDIDDAVSDPLEAPPRADVTVPAVIPR